MLFLFREAPQGVAVEMEQFTHLVFSVESAVGAFLRPHMWRAKALRHLFLSEKLAQKAR